MASPPVIEVHDPRDNHFPLKQCLTFVTSDSTTLTVRHFLLCTTQLRRPPLPAALGAPTSALWYMLYMSWMTRCRTPTTVDLAHVSHPSSSAGRDAQELPPEEDRPQNPILGYCQEWLSAEPVEKELGKGNLIDSKAILRRPGSSSSRKWRE